VFHNFPGLYIPIDPFNGMSHSLAGRGDTVDVMYIFCFLHLKKWGWVESWHRERERERERARERERERESEREREREREIEIER
jgi:hypothetical protein